MTQLETQKRKSLNSNNEGKIFPNHQTPDLKKLKLKIGDVSVVTINALGLKNLGLAELKNGYTVFVPKSKLGETVKIQIEKISTQPKYAIGKILETVKQTKTMIPVQVEDILELTVQKQGPQGSGLHLLNENFTIVVKPKSKNLPIKIGEKLTVKINRLKENYAFAELINMDPKKTTRRTLEAKTLSSELLMAKESFNLLSLNSCFNLTLPLNTKCLANYAIVKLKKSLVFIKMSLGAQFGDTVRIRIVKTTKQYSIAKITKLSPMPKKAKQLLVKNNVKRMIASGVHYGEKAVRCHAEMRKFLWIRKKGKNQNRPFMKRGRHIINVLKTRVYLDKALKQLAKYAAKGKTFLFVGTKKPAASLIARTAMLSKTSYFVNTRWLGGMLTNWKTILKSISQIRPILKEKQKMIRTILEKRQKIKTQLLKKVNILRKKSEKLLVKGKQLLSKIKQDKNILITRRENLSNTKTEIVLKTKNLLQKYSVLKTKKEQLIADINSLKTKGNSLIQQKAKLIKQIENRKQKLEEFKQLHSIAREVAKVKTEISTQGKTIWAIPFENSSSLGSSTELYLIPNPSTKILNNIINMMKSKYTKNLLTSENFNFVSFSAFQPEVSRRSTSKFDGNNRAKSTEKDTVLMSQLLNKMTDYLPFMETYMTTLVKQIEILQSLVTKLDQNLQILHTNIETLNSVDIQKQIDNSLNSIKSKLESELTNLQLLKRRLKQLAAEQKLLKFLPKLRYLPTSKKKMLETVEFLMKKFVDPKMSYSIDQVYERKLKFTSKKLAATRKQKWQRLEKYFGGVTKMAKMKRKQIANNVVILVGQQEEMNAVHECRKLGMKMFTIVDTNCNPRLSDYIIPANDDSRNAIKLVLGQMLTYIRLGQTLRKKILAKRALS